MNRLLLSCFLFTLCLSPAAGAQTPPPATESSTPAWLPRGAMVGSSFREGTASPQVRLTWRLPFFRGRKDSLSLIFEPMAAFTVGLPDALNQEGEDSSATLDSLQLYSLLVGVGYRSRPPTGLEWGFQIGTGPAWYSARFSDASKDDESYVIGLLDGRGQIGYNFGRVAVGVAVGYGDPYNYKRSSLSRPYLGGLHLGLYSEWR